MIYGSGGEDWGFQLIFTKVYYICRSEPTLKVDLEETAQDVEQIVFKTANLKVEDILTKFNELVLPLVKVEIDDERTTKGAKKSTAPSKTGKKGK